MTRKVLLVDDEPNILASYKRNLRKTFELDTALGGEAGLEYLERRGPYAVVVSDLRMPYMDGVRFLSEVRRRSPESVRILLTGQAEVQDAVQVVNEGQIFRFLTKPCPPDVFRQAVESGFEQYRLVMAERELLNNTLKGSVKVLVDIISILSPDTISRAIRVRSYAGKVARRLGMRDLWQVDVAALLSQIGCVTVPSEIMKKKASGLPLSQKERETFLKHLEVGQALVANIPRLEAVAEAIAYQEKHYDGGGLPFDGKKGKEIPLLARILKVLLDFDDVVLTGKSESQAVEELRRRPGRYDPDVVAALHAELLRADQGYVVAEVSAEQVQVGMILADDLRTRTNLLLLPRRHEISNTVRICILNFAQSGNLVEPIRILKKATPDVSVARAQGSP